MVPNGSTQIWLHDSVMLEFLTNRSKKMLTDILIADRVIVLGPVQFAFQGLLVENLFVQVAVAPFPRRLVVQSKAAWPTRGWALGFPKFFTMLISASENGCIFAKANVSGKGHGVLNSWMDG